MNETLRRMHEPVVPTDEEASPSAGGLVNDYRLLQSIIARLDPVMRHTYNQLRSTPTPSDSSNIQTTGRLLSHCGNALRTMGDVLSNFPYDEAEADSPEITISFETHSLFNPFEMLLGGGMNMQELIDVPFPGSFLNGMPDPSSRRQERSRERDARGQRASRPSGSGLGASSSHASRRDRGPGDNATRRSSSSSVSAPTVPSTSSTAPSSAPADRESNRTAGAPPNFVTGVVNALHQILSRNAADASETPPAASPRGGTSTPLRGSRGTSRPRGPSLRLSPRPSPRKRPIG